MSTLPVNTRLQNGAFTIGKVLGKGGFGITYLCGDMNLRRVVAIKEFFPEDCLRKGNSVQPRDSMSAEEYSGAKSEFLEEARVLARFHHPGIVAVHTFFEENNTAYMVMEYLKGKTLAQLVEERGALPEAEAIEHIKKIGEALEELHRSQLLHRDVKPENAIVCEGGRVVLIDFGLTKKVEEVIGLGTRQLAATTRFGSDGFAPPEQYLRSGVPGKYTDVYALGATLYYLLTGTVPNSAPERAMGAGLTPVHQINSIISRNVSDAVVQAMELDKDKRPQLAGDFLDLLTKRAVTVPPSNGTTLIPIPVARKTNATPARLIQGFTGARPDYHQGLVSICPHCLCVIHVPDDTQIGEIVLCCSCSQRFDVTSVNKKVITPSGTAMLSVPTLEIVEIGKTQLELKDFPKHNCEIKITLYNLSDGSKRIHITTLPLGSNSSKHVIQTDKAGLAKLKVLIENAEKLLP